eukprot:2854983-Rhodomonas_salina.2
MAAIVLPFKKRAIPPSDAFFDAGNLARELCFKKLSVASSEMEFMEAEDPVVCGIGGCKAVLKSVEMYEVHYASLHINVCSVCHRVMPTCRLLSLHVQEAHDSFFAEMSKRENMYECLVEGCGKKFKGDFQRRWHLINVHQYPKTFRFHFEPPAAQKDTKKGKKKTQRTPALHTRPTGEEGMLEDMEAGDDEGMEDICDGMRQLSFPAQIRFGHNSERGLMRPPREKKTDADGKKKKNRKPLGPKASNQSMLDVGEKPQRGKGGNAMDTEQATRGLLCIVVCPCFAMPGPDTASGAARCSGERRQGRCCKPSFAQVEHDAVCCNRVDGLLMLSACTERGIRSPWKQ